MRNGEGLRVVLFVSGCEHRCPFCHNKETWDQNSGIAFDESAKKIIYCELEKEHIDGLTISGGDPFHPTNIDTVTKLIHDIKTNFSNKTIWVYTGYDYEYLVERHLYSIVNVDVLVDGVFKNDLADVNYQWAGSTNQRVLNIQKSLKQNKIILYTKE